MRKSIRISSMNIVLRCIPCQIRVIPVLFTKLNATSFFTLFAAVLLRKMRLQHFIWCCLVTLFLIKMASRRLSTGVHCLKYSVVFLKAIVPWLLPWHPRMQSGLFASALNSCPDSQHPVPQAQSQTASWGCTGRIHWSGVRRSNRSFCPRCPRLLRMAPALDLRDGENCLFRLDFRIIRSIAVKGNNRKFKGWFHPIPLVQASMLSLTACITVSAVIRFWPWLFPIISEAWQSLLIIRAVPSEAFSAASIASSSKTVWLQPAPDSFFSTLKPQKLR